MPNQIALMVLERRDETNRVALGNAAFAACRAIKESQGIKSAKFYWQQSDQVIIIVEGEKNALDNMDQNPEYVRTGLALTDLARIVQNMRLSDPRFSDELYRSAGRS